MKRIIAFTAALLTGAVVVSAQQTTPATPATPSAPQQPAASQSRPAADKVTVTGCLRQGASAGTFILADASPAAAGSASGGAGAVGTAGSASSASRKTYALTVKAGEDLKAHLNHRMEIVGVASARPAAQSGSTAGSGMPSGAAASGAGAASGSGQTGTVSGSGQAGAAGQSGSAAGSSASASQPTDNLEVQSFKMVAASCS